MLELNWVDYLILMLLIIHAYLGYSLGFLGATLDLTKLVISLIVGLVIYEFFGKILANTISIPQGFASAISFFTIAVLIQIFIRELLKKYFIFNPTIFKTVNQIIGFLAGSLSGVIFSSFLLILAIALPVSSHIKDSVFLSQIGSVLVSYSQTAEKKLKEMLGGNILKGLNFLTVDPSSTEKIILNFRPTTTNVDRSAENYMLDLINEERFSRGLPELVFDDQLRNIGRQHCSDMFENRYFSHYNPQNFSPSDRLEEENIIYSRVGENLVLSPNASLAMEGLMDSPMHSANILSIYFGRVGVGVIDGGIYGKMFCQEFTD